MEAIVLYLITILLAAVLGAVSFAIVVSLGVATQRWFGFHREGVIAILTIAGLVACAIANAYNIRWLALGVLFWGWIALLPMVIVAMACWQLLRAVRVTWRRLTIRSS